MSTYVDLGDGNKIYEGLELIGKKGLVITLFFIGASLSISTIKEVGIKASLMGVLVWLFISVFSLLVVFGAGLKFYQICVKAFKDSILR